MTPEHATSPQPADNPDQLTRIIEIVRMLIVAGIPFGVVVAGVGSRLSMLLLRLTSSDQVIGVRSDDGFVIGKFTLGGTYNLLALGAAVGIIGAAAYLLVAPRLIGPTWFRHLTVGLASAAVVGAMVIQPDSVDFTQLTPTWLAVALFVALPGVFGTFIGPAVSAVASPTSWTIHGPNRWALPVIAVACFAPIIPVVLATIAAVAVLTALGNTPPLTRLRRTHAYIHTTRAAWLLIALTGSARLVQDLQLLT